MIWVSILLLLAADSSRESPSERLNPPREVPIGAPPLLAFRYFQGKERHRFGDFNLVIDDAGH